MQYFKNRDGSIVYADEPDNPTFIVRDDLSAEAKSDIQVHREFVVGGRFHTHNHCLIYWCDNARDWIWVDLDDIAKCIEEIEQQCSTREMRSLGKLLGARGASLPVVYMPGRSVISYYDPVTWRRVTTKHGPPIEAQKKMSEADLVKVRLFNEQKHKGWINPARLTTTRWLIYTEDGRVEMNGEEASLVEFDIGMLASRLTREAYYSELAYAMGNPYYYRHFLGDAPYKLHADARVSYQYEGEKIMSSRKVPPMDLPSAIREPVTKFLLDNIFTKVLYGDYEPSKLNRDLRVDVYGLVYFGDAPYGHAANVNPEDMSYRQLQSLRRSPRFLAHRLTHADFEQHDGGWFSYMKEGRKCFAMKRVPKRYQYLVTS